MRHICIAVKFLQFKKSMFKKKILIKLDAPFFEREGGGGESEESNLYNRFLSQRYKHAIMKQIQMLF